jgi:hypothetical protein
MLGWATKNYNNLVGNKTQHENVNLRHPQSGKYTVKLFVDTEFTGIVKISNFFVFDKLTVAKSVFVKPVFWFLNKIQVDPMRYSSKLSNSI